MSERETQINLAHSEVYAGLSVIWFTVIEYEDQILPEDFTIIEGQIQFARDHVDALRDIAQKADYESSISFCV
ncbi:hypothetical protein [Terasakiella pusilla]|uniref:hypothetical protein n=1 Tax=Terasakiella pusilla TaxID=64973 RepID=UPI003AA96ADE